jgi:hypothetical protein
VRMAVTRARKHCSAVHHVQGIQIAGHRTALLEEDAVRLQGRWEGHQGFGSTLT